MGVSAMKVIQHKSRLLAGRNRELRELDRCKHELQYASECMTRYLEQLKQRTPVAVVEGGQHA